MTWFGELRHLLIKDLTEHRWTVGLYLAAVLVATGHTLGWHPFMAPVVGITMVFVGLIGAVLAASVVQGDSPTRSDAFWASHPIDASAVLAAKLCLGVAVLALPVLAQVLAMHRYDVSWGDALAKSLHDARMYALIVLGAMVVAALTRDLKSFLLTVIAIPVALLICVAIISSTRNGGLGFTLKPREGQIATLLFVLLELVLLAWLFHTRDARWLTRLGGFALVALSYVGLAFAGNAPTAGMREATEVAHVPLAIEWASQREQRATSPLAMAVVIGPEERGFHYDFAGPSATARLRDGSTIALWMSAVEIGPGVNSSAQLPVIPGIRWLNVDGTQVGAAPRLHRVLLEPVPTEERRRTLDTGIENVVVSGSIVVTRQTTGVAVPLAAGAFVIHDGRSVQVESVRRDRVNTEIDVNTRNVIGQPIFAGPVSNAQLEYVLVNRARGEGIVLAPRETRFSGDGMVVPGSTMTSRLVRYGLPIGPGGSAIVGDDWLRDAQLQAVDAVPLGSYAVRLPPLSPPGRSVAGRG